MEVFAKVAKDLKRPLSKSDVEKIVGEPVTLITADNKNQLYESLDSNKMYDLYLIHYLSEINKNYESGHWVGLAVDNYKKKIYFFDPYGEFVDDGLKYLSKKFREYTGQDSRDVGKFMKYMACNYGYQLYYSQFHYQKLKTGINTCGRWTGMFLKHISHGGTENSFNKLVKELMEKYKIKDSDVFITLITNNLIK